MLDGYRRLPLQSVGSRASFYSDTLFIQIPKTTISRLNRNPQPSGRKTVAVLRSLSHEIIHYHQFVGTTTGYVLRLIMTARDRLRYLGLKNATEAARERMAAARKIDGPLVQARPGGMPLISDKLRDAFDDAQLQLILWLDAAERFLIAPTALDQKLFASGPNVFGALLDVCRRLSIERDDLDYDDMLNDVGEAGKAAFEAAGPLWDCPATLTYILEAHAVVNQAAFMANTPRRVVELYEAWQTAPEYLLLIAGMNKTAFPDDNIQSWRIHGSVALLTDIVLNGWEKPGVGLIWSSPRQFLNLVLRAPIPWAELMDHELTLWSPDELTQKRDRIKKALESVIDAVDEESDIPKALPAGNPQAHAIPNMMNQFEILRDASLSARGKNYAASILPGEASRLYPEKLEETGFIDDTICPFLLIGDRDYSVKIDRHTYIRWALGAFTEQATYGFFTDVTFRPQGLSSEQVKGYIEATMQKSPFLRCCFQ